jgi:hypothetical protein
MTFDPFNAHRVLTYSEDVSHQRSSVVISGHQWSSVVVSGHQWSPVVISGHHQRGWDVRITSSVGIPSKGVGCEDHQQRGDPIPHRQADGIVKAWDVRRLKDSSPLFILPAANPTLPSGGAAPRAAASR